MYASKTISGGTTARRVYRVPVEPLPRCQRAGCNRPATTAIYFTLANASSYACDEHADEVEARLSGYEPPRQR